MKAIATQIGNSKKERIDLDGKMFLKSVVIGKWNYIIKITEKDGSTHYGKSATRENAEKWVPWAMRHEMVISAHDYRADNEKVEAFKAKYPNWSEQPYRGRYMGLRPILLVAPIEYTREIVKVER